MIFLYDYIAASIVGVAVFFIVVAVQSGGVETSHEQTRYYSAKTYVLNFREMAEHDFGNLGAGVARQDPVFLAKTDSTISFMAKLEAGDTEPATITYRRLSAGTMAVDGEDVPVYRVERVIDDVVTGESPPTTRAFTVILRDAAGAETADLDAVASIHIESVIMSPLSTGEKLHEARWTRTFWPANLSNFE